VTHWATLTTTTTTTTVHDVTEGREQVGSEVGSRGQHVVVMKAGRRVHVSTW
jgi:hypothetical protein